MKELREGRPYFNSSFQETHSPEYIHFRGINRFESQEYHHGFPDVVDYVEVEGCSLVTRLCDEFES